MSSLNQLSALRSKVVAEKGHIVSRRDATVSIELLVDSLDGSLIGHLMPRCEVLSHEE